MRAHWCACLLAGGGSDNYLRPGTSSLLSPASLLRTRQAAVTMAMTDRVFSAAEAQGGRPIDPSSTAIVLIEYQNEFCAPGGKLHDAVQGVMASTNMLQNSIQLVDAARAKGCKIMHTPISFAPDGSDNPNKGLGILKGCYDNGFFTRGVHASHLVCAPACACVCVRACMHANVSCLFVYFSRHNVNTG